MLEKFPIFKDKVSLTEWLQSHPAQAKEYCRWKLERRKLEKNLKYTLTQVELRSLPDFPSYRQLNQITGNFPLFSEALGYENRYKHYLQVKQLNPISGSNQIIYIDTREKSPVRVDNSVKIQGLKYGDYALSNSELSGGLVIERKSLTDLIGTISGGYDRFLNELDRAAENNAPVVVLVEDTLTNALTFNNKWVRKFTRAQPHFIWHRIRDIIQMHRNVQFLFSGNRSESARLIKKLLYNGQFLKDFDLQLLLDCDLL